MKKYLSPFYIFEIIIEYLVYFIFLYNLSKNIHMSLILLFIILYIKFIYKNVSIFKNSIISKDFDLLLLKPVNPILKILIYELNPIDIIIQTVILVILCTYLPSFILMIFSILIILLALYLFILSATLFISNKLSVEKILPLIILLLLIPLISLKYIIGFNSLLVGLSSLLFSVSFLFLSIQLWNHSLKKYL